MAAHSTLYSVRQQSTKAQRQRRYQQPGAVHLNVCMVHRKRQQGLLTFVVGLLLPEGCLALLDAIRA